MVGLRFLLILSLTFLLIIHTVMGTVTPPVPSQKPNVWYHFEDIGYDGTHYYFIDAGESPVNNGVAYYSDTSFWGDGYYSSGGHSSAKGLKVDAQEYVEIQPSSDLVNTEVLTIEFYLYMSEDYDGDGTIMDNFNIDYFYWVFYANGKLYVQIWKYDTFDHIDLIGNCPVGQWHHVAFVIDGVNNIAKLFIDGKKVDEKTIFSDWVVVDSAYHNIGSRYYDIETGYYIIDEFRYYNYSLSEDEILKHTELLRVSGYDENTGAELTAHLILALSGNVTYNEFQYDSVLDKHIMFYQPGFEWGYYWLTAKNDSYFERTITVHLDEALKQVNVYLINRSDEVILQVFKLNDFYNQFEKPRLILKKSVGGELVTVLDKIFDFNDQAQDYLLWGSQYQLSVVDDEKGVQLTLGWFSPDPDGVVEITPNLYVIPTVTENVTVDLSADQNTGTIILNYNCSSEITKVEFYINLTNGTNVFYSDSTEKAGSFVYNANNTTSYDVHFIVWKDGSKAYERSWFIGWGGKAELYILPSTFPKWTYTLISVGMIILMLLLFGSYNATVGTGLAFGLALLLWWFGWLDVNEIVLGLMGLIAGASVVYHHRRRVGG